MTMQKTLVGSAISSKACGSPVLIDEIWANVSGEVRMTILNLLSYKVEDRLFLRAHNVVQFDADVLSSDLQSQVLSDLSDKLHDRHTEPLCVSLMANVAYRVLSPIGNKLSNEVAANMLPVPNALQQSVESDVNLHMVMGQASGGLAFGINKSFCEAVHFATREELRQQIARQVDRRINGNMKVAILEAVLEAVEKTQPNVESRIKFEVTDQVRTAVTEAAVAIKPNVESRIRVEVMEQVRTAITESAAGPIARTVLDTAWFGTEGRLLVNDFFATVQDHLLCSVKEGTRSMVSYSLWTAANHLIVNEATAVVDFDSRKGLNAMCAAVEGDVSAGIKVPVFSTVLNEEAIKSALAASVFDTVKGEVFMQFQHDVAYSVRVTTSEEVQGVVNASLDFGAANASLQSYHESMKGLEHEN
jgi:hypothetical protein